MPNVRFGAADCRRIAASYASLGPIESSRALGISVHSIEYIMRVRCPKLGIVVERRVRPKMTPEERLIRRREVNRSSSRRRASLRRRNDVSQVDYDARAKIGEMRKRVVKNGAMDSAGLLELIALRCKRAA